MTADFLYCVGCHEAPLTLACGFSVVLFVSVNCEHAFRCVSTFHLGSAVVFWMLFPVRSQVHVDQHTQTKLKQPMYLR